MNNKAIFSMIIAALSFSFCPLLYAISLETASPLAQAFYVQLFVTIVASFFILIVTKRLDSLYKPLISLFKLPWETWSVIVLSGVGGYMGTLFFLWALGLMSDAGASIIMEAWPILAVLISPVLISTHRASIRLLDIALIILLFIGLSMIYASDTGITLDQFVKNPIFMFENGTFDDFLGIICAFMSAFCYAWAGVSRPYFLSLLSDRFNQTYLLKNGECYSSLFAFWLTCLTAMPLALISAWYFEDTVFSAMNNLYISIGLGVLLTSMGCFYAFSLMKATSSTINLLWYFAPVLATIWLVLFGYSQLTPLLILGGFLIILANLILILTNKQTTNEIA